MDKILEFSNFILIFCLLAVTILLPILIYKSGIKNYLLIIVIISASIFLILLVLKVVIITGENISNDLIQILLFFDMFIFVYYFILFIFSMISYKKNILLLYFSLETDNLYLWICEILGFISILFFFINKIDRFLFPSISISENKNPIILSAFILLLLLLKRTIFFTKRKLFTYLKNNGKPCVLNDHKIFSISIMIIGIVSFLTINIKRGNFILYNIDFLLITFLYIDFIILMSIFFKPNFSNKDAMSNLEVTISTSSVDLKKINEENNDISIYETKKQGRETDQIMKISFKTSLKKSNFDINKLYIKNCKLIKMANKGNEIYLVYEKKQKKIKLEIEYELTNRYTKKKCRYKRKTNLLISIINKGNNIIIEEFYLENLQKNFFPKNIDSRIKKIQSKNKRDYDFYNILENHYFYLESLESYESNSFKKCILLNNMMGSGKTSFLNRTIAEKLFKPITISPWAEGYKHDILYLLYKECRKNAKTIFNLKNILYKEGIVAFSLISLFLFTLINIANSVLKISELPYGLNKETAIIFTIVSVVFLSIYLTAKYTGDFIILKKDASKYHYDYYIEYIVRNVKYNRLVLCIEDLDRITDKNIIRDIFTIIDKYNQVSCELDNKTVIIISMEKNRIIIKNNLKKRKNVAFEDESIKETFNRSFTNEEFDELYKKCIEKEICLPTLKESINQYKEDIKLFIDNNMDFEDLGELKKIEVFEKLEKCISFREIASLKSELVKLINDREYKLSNYIVSKSPLLKKKFKPFWERFWCDLIKDYSKNLNGSRLFYPVMKLSYKITGEDKQQFYKYYNLQEKVCKRIANFMPLPKCLIKLKDNSYNGYSDLFFRDIHGYFHNKLSEEKKKDFLKEEAYFKCFGEGEEGWINFVEKNYLQDFFDNTKEEKNLYDKFLLRYPIGLEFDQLPIQKKFWKKIYKKGEKNTESKEYKDAYLKYCENSVFSIMNRARRLDNSDKAIRNK